MLDGGLALDAVGELCAEQLPQRIVLRVRDEECLEQHLAEDTRRERGLYWAGGKKTGGSVPGSRGMRRGHPATMGCPCP